MSSIRERILRELVTRCAAAVAPAPLLRFPTIPVTREASPVLLLFVEGDTVTAHANALVDRQLIVRLVALARGDGAFDTADRLVVAAHAALMADTNLGGLALGLREIDCEWEAEDADGGAAAIPARYEIRYRTLAADLTRHG
ncbi:hypothetical protein LWS69_00665 [Bordetella hinzii]|nr:hypothetical protein [Bordetella hinzii]